MIDRLYTIIDALKRHDFGASSMAIVDDILLGLEAYTGTLGAGKRTSVATAISFRERTFPFHKFQIKMHHASTGSAQMTEERPYMLLTGASRGIGHATVKLFQSKGWRILTVSRQPFSEECAWPSARESHIQADLSDLTQIDRLAATVRERLPNGRLHALVNNAGISPKGLKKSRLGVMGTDADIWTQVLNVNVVSTALIARALMPELEAAKGSIVNVTSIAGTRVHPFAGVAYAASKAALGSLTREMAHEFGRRGVRANAIAPGEIETSILSPGTDALVAAEVPMQRLGDPHEVAETIYFLCTEPSSYINGAEIHINGGQHV